jgi:hypothetical protein
MSKFRCVCGHVITTSGAIPNPDEWLFISDTAYDEFEGDGDQLYMEFGRAYVCPVSGHLWVFRDEAQPEPYGYAPISEECAGTPARSPVAPPDESLS